MGQVQLASGLFAWDKAGKQSIGACAYPQKSKMDGVGTSVELVTLGVEPRTSSELKNVKLAL